MPLFCLTLCFQRFSSWQSSFSISSMLVYAMMHSLTFAFIGCSRNVEPIQAQGLIG